MNAAIEPAFLSERRRRALDEALSVPLPDRAQHRFRYTAPASLVPGGAITQALIQGAATAGVDIEVPRAAAEAGIVAIPLQAALARDPGVVAEYLGRLVPPADPLAAVGLAAFGSGAVVVIPPGARVSEPVVVRHRVDGLGLDGLSAVRLLVVLGREAEAAVIEEVDVGSGYVHATAEAHVGDGGRLTLARVSSVARGATAFVVAGAEVGQDALLTHADVGIASGLLKVETSPVLAGRGAVAEGLGATVTGGRGRADFRVREDHAGTDSRSRVTWRAVAAGKAQAVFTGLLRIREHAVRSEGYEEARAMLLSRTAKADIIPELEILNHDVRCSHGAAVGPVDEEALFYLMTRGLTAAEAEALLIEGFLAPVLSSIGNDGVAQALGSRLSAGLAGVRGA